jgi:xylan 1,4-beta-xylosidase
MRPFAEISFTPPPLATATDSTAWLLWYNFHPANITPPKDWTKWSDFMAALVQHLEQRYGECEVQNNWYFEVWNEASWMLSTGVGGYKNICKYAVQGLKAGDPKVRVGGPAESGPGSASAISNLISYASTNSLRLDFVTYHRYANDNDAGIANANAMNDVHTRLVNSATGAGFNGDVIVTEWGPAIIVNLFGTAARKRIP